MKKFEEKESVVFEIEGQKLFGMLHMPITHEKKVPGVLMFHGLAGNKTGRFRIYVHLAKELAKIGIASLRVDFRGCGDSDGEFSEATVSGFLKDAWTSLKYLTHHTGIDSTRIGLFGRSFGAAIALMTAHEYKKMKSIALWAPLFNTAQWLEKWRFFNSGSLSQPERDVMLSIDGQMGNYEFFDEFFKLDLESKLDLLSDIPLLHIHGNKDAIIDIHHADLYQDKRKTARAISEFIRLTDGDHEFSNRQHQQTAISETVEWFKKTL